MKTVKIAILIPVFNHLDFTKNCLNNLKTCLNDNKLSDFEIIVCDDGSTDGTSAWVSENHPEVHLLHGDGNLWWSGGINKSARHACEVLKCTHVLLWNNDIEIEASYFAKLVELASYYDDSTILGSKIYANKEMTIVWHMGGRFIPKTGTSYMIGFMEKDAPEYNTIHEVDWITGMGTLVPAAVIKDIAYWDDENFPQYHGDTEYTYRAKIKGYKLLIIPELSIYNDIENTGFVKKESLKDLIKLLSDKRSSLCFSVNKKFLKLYGKGLFRYNYLSFIYFKTIGGWMKWSVLNLFGMQRKA